ncbi:HemK methyltransferase family member 2 [Zancudomyces culisetae]|uniref:HemK methyltransferase family member 2 n=1 Tax=Zancudomyces culisetae TaxID=1213189 RepID=A0A1R1PX21_ZANCU|nr:HemK methyltransferase family member 2 [Zancudomyces culisetae]|eukprot:OMH85474.1 HemK methyltransferase family member 2 [Zancudomyces culisetae]
MACECTLKTATVERVRDRIDTIRSFFTSGLHRRIYGSVDILVFNPPYVPTDSEEAIPEPSRICCDKDCSSDKEMVESLMAASWAGGVDGREVMDNFFPHVNINYKIEIAFGKRSILPCTSRSE